MKNTFDFDVQSLERRQMLAGEVTIFQNSAGDITLRGDSLGNSVEISAVGNGNILVQGQSGTTLKWDGSTSTVFEVATNEPHTFQRNLKFLGLGGNDFLILQDVKVNGGFVASMSAGNDSIFAGTSVVEGPTTIRGGSGDDQLHFSFMGFAGRVRVFENGRANAAVGSSVLLTDCEFNSDVAIVGSSKRDILLVGSSQFDGDLSMRSLGGDDHVYVSAYEVVGKTKLNVGSGNDVIEVGETDFMGDATIVLGGGDDELDFVELAVFFGDAMFNGGRQFDTLTGVVPGFTPGTTIKTTSFEDNQLG